MSSPLAEFVLVRPSRAVNVASACRALKNMGFSSLRVVGALPEAELREARGAAYAAWDVLDGSKVFADLESALADCALAFGASGKAPWAGGTDDRPAQEDPAWSPRRLARFAIQLPAGTRLALVFGPEQRGLSHEELRLCQHVVRIPSDAAQASLNLAQAVLVIAYELFVAAQEERGPRGAASRPWSERAALEHTLAHWREALQEIGYLKEPQPGRLLAELRRLLTRAQPSPRELELLRGIARQAAWAGRVARARRDVR